MIGIHETVFCNGKLVATGKQKNAIVTGTCEALTMGGVHLT